MGKKRNRRNRKNKNKLKNTCTEEKSNTIFEQHGSNKSNVLSKKNENHICQKSEYDHKVSKVKEQFVLNENIFQNSHVIKYSPAEHASNVMKCSEKCGVSVSNGVNEDQDVFALFGVRPKHNTDICLNKDDLSDKLGSSLLDSSESDDEKEYTSSDFFKPVFSGQHKGETSSQHRNEESLKLEKNLLSSVTEYQSSKDSFSSIYHRWLPERKNTLEKLRSLYTEVHGEQVKFNKTQAALKELSFASRFARQQTENQTVDFLTSVSAFFSDAVSGVMSFAQALDIDSYQNKFQEIMDHDAEITKEMYEVRSCCVSKYLGIEEVIRKFHSDTFDSTVDKITNTLEIGKYWKGIKEAYKDDNMPKLMDVVGKFFEHACQSEVLEDVSGSFQKYVDDNPAALEACKSTGKALYGAANALGIDKNRNGAMGRINSTVNLCLMLDDKKEVDRLKNVISEDCNQSKLESLIEDAINSLESEMEEISDIYYKYFFN